MPDPASGWACGPVQGGDRQTPRSRAVQGTRGAGPGKALGTLTPAPGPGRGPGGRATTAEDDSWHATGRARTGRPLLCKPREWAAGACARWVRGTWGHTSHAAPGGLGASHSRPAHCLLTCNPGHWQGWLPHARGRGEGAQGLPSPVPAGHQEEEGERPGRPDPPGTAARVLWGVLRPGIPRELPVGLVCQVTQPWGAQAAEGAHVGAEWQPWR